MQIIAEIGSNWKTYDDCVRAIRIAKKCGADAVKFQYFTSADLYGVSGKAVACIPNTRALSIEANAHDIEFMCTAFHPMGYVEVDPWVKRHKIASSEITDESILRAVNDLKKPVIVSTGGASFEEIDRALEILNKCPVTLLYCVVSYPARVVDFRHLYAMVGRYGSLCSYGYSDHSTDVLCIPSLSRSFGATVLEKHVNFFDYTDTPDAPHSLSKYEFALMVKHLRGESNLSETFTPNPWKRKMITLPNGTCGYFRPLPDAG